MSEKVSSGLEKFDKKYGGYRRNGVTILAQRPSMGNIAFMISSLVELVKKNQPVLFVSRELNFSDFFAKVVSNITQIELSKIIDPKKFSHGEMQEFIQKTVEVFDMLKGQCLFFNYLDLEGIQTKLNEFKGDPVLFIDVRGLDFNENNFNELHEFAKNKNVTVVSTFMLPRSIELREDKIPTVQDIDLFNNFKNDFDFYTFYRDEVYERNSSKENIVEIFSLDKQDSSIPLELSFDLSKQKIV